MPYHLDNTEFEKIEISIPRKSVNVFLSNLWDDFNRTIGDVGCYHNYLATNNFEIYEYNIHWAVDSLPFVAELSFYNHTSDGLKYILLSTLDSETKKPEYKFRKSIKESIQRCLKINIKLELKGYVKLPFLTKLKLSGNYRFDTSDIFILGNKHDVGGYIIFPVFSNSNSNAEINYEIIDLY